MLLTIVGPKIHIVVTPEEAKRLNAGLTAKGVAKLKASPFSVVVEVVETITETKEPPSHTPIEKELP